MKKANFVFLPGVFCEPNILWEAQKNKLANDANVFNYDLSSYASIDAAITRIISNSPEKFFLIGFSLGGQVALELFRKIPERIKGFLVMSASPRPPAEATRARVKNAIHGIKTKGLESFMSSFYDGYFNNDTFKQKYLDMTKKVGVEGCMNHLRIVESIEDKPFPNIICPTEILCGADDDKTTPELHREFHKKIAESKLNIIPSVRHYIMWVQPEKINEVLIKWLKN